LKLKAQKINRFYEKVAQSIHMYKQEAIVSPWLLKWGALKERKKIQGVNNSFGGTCDEQDSKWNSLGYVEEAKITHGDWWHSG
jgi:hypothetical protein